jgi:hypothetical protein
MTNEEELIIDNHRGRSSVALGIRGTKEQINLRHNSLYNFGATTVTELNWMHDGFAYTWINPQNLRDYFLKSSMAMLINNKSDGCGKAFKGLKGPGKGALQRAKELAKERMAKIKVEPFLALPSVNSDTYEVTTTNKYDN